MDDPGKYMLNDSAAKAAVLEILGKGHSVELPATGLSMFPTFRPGDRVVVRSVRKDEMPEKGDVVVHVEKGAGRKAQGAGRRVQGAEQEEGAESEELSGVFVMHRLVEITKDDSGELWFITRGDSRTEADKPWPVQQLVGVAVSYRSGNKERVVRRYVPSEFRYMVNWWLLWGWGKLGSITSQKVAKFKYPDPKKLYFL